MNTLAKARTWSHETRLFLRASEGPKDFARVMQSRLSLSKVGRVVAPRRVTARVNLGELGPGVALRSHTSDISVLGELLEGSYSHLPPAGAAIASVVDLGANTGLAFRWLHGRYPDARFVCVEPDAGNFAVLEQNARASGADVTVLEACAGGWERKVSLVTETGEFGFHMDEDGDRPGEIPVLTMPQILERGAMPSTIDVLKCDIEGAEDELFADCRSWIGRVRWIVAECHHPYTADTLESALEANGASSSRVFLERNDPFGCETVTLRLAA
jgi:FkbM family methyltransferase